MTTKKSKSAKKETPIEKIKRKVKNAKVKNAKVIIDVWLVGDVMRLTAEASRRNPVTLDKQTFKDAELVASVPEFLGGGWELSRPLNGSVYWQTKELIRVSKSKVVHVQQLPMKLYCGFMPSNFSIDQLKALRAFEDAVSVNTQPARSNIERRGWRKHVIETYDAVRDAGVVDSLTEKEKEHVAICIVNL